MHGDKQDLKEIPKIQHASRPLDATFNLWKSHHTCAQRISALPTTLVARFFGYHDPKDQRKVKQTGIWSNQEVSLSLSLSVIDLLSLITDPDCLSQLKKHMPIHMLTNIQILH